MHSELKKLALSLDGDLLYDEVWRILYATDASAYREKPLAVARPRNSSDIKKLIAFAANHNTTLIPRAAGTSLAGQVVGEGIVVDISKYMTAILQFNKEEKWVRVQPGVNLDELNMMLKPHGLLFGPETSTANRCLIGGMLGNNACGLHSLVYGSVRDHTLAVKAILGDGSEVEFTKLSVEEFNEKCKGDTLENKIYADIKEILSNPDNQQEIRSQYPDKAIKRRNTGYAIDLLLETAPFTEGAEDFNFCKLIAGSEGTLAFVTEITLNLIELPPPVKGLVCVHCKDVKESLQANLIALRYKPEAVELMDNVILELTKNNIEQRKNRFFVQGDPGAILIVEFARNSREEIEDLARDMEAEMRAAGYGYHFPIVYGSEIKKVWELRKAGLGVLSNMPGDAKPVSVIEDTSVSPEKLPDYIDEFQKILKKYNLSCVYHAHIATGELHLRPILNLKDASDVEVFHNIAEDTARLVKKFKGSLSGEHGDGRLRGEFIPFMIGEKNYNLLKRIKQVWDPKNIFNAKKIIATPSMNSSLRYEPGKPTREIDTIFDFSSVGGIIRAAEQCNGSGDCRKSERIGGTMCPSFMATRDETNVTRARANILREFLTHSPKKNPFDHKEIYQVMDLCLSCKACKSECPSSIDVAKLKAEFLQHYYDAHGVPMRARLIANITIINALGSLWPAMMNCIMGNSFIRNMTFPLFGFHPARTMPAISPITLRRWMKKYVRNLQSAGTKGKVLLFCDEFTNYNDSHIGIQTIRLLNKLGYEVAIPRHGLSGRSFLSKGLVRKAKSIANANILALRNIVSANNPLVGIEPSAILVFRDEYPELVDAHLRDNARRIAENTMLLDEFIAAEATKGNIDRTLFTEEKRHVLFHGHCQQKAIASTKTIKTMLSLPVNYTVEEIPSGCCGMAGAFGYEKEHYDVSMKIGELVLFPSVRKASTDTIIAAPGTSCRHHIKEGTGRAAMHPAEVLYAALRNQ